jgi:hypothetical protein
MIKHYILMKIIADAMYNSEALNKAMIQADTDVVLYQLGENLTSDITTEDLPAVILNSVGSTKSSHSYLIDVFFNADMTPTTVTQTKQITGETEEDTTTQTIKQQKTFNTIKMADAALDIIMREINKAIEPFNL